jgi:hypothetical protein
MVPHPTAQQHIYQRLAAFSQTNMWEENPWLAY